MFQTQTLFGISQPLTLWSFVATYRQVQFISKLCTCVPTRNIHYFPYTTFSSVFLIEAQRIIWELSMDPLHTMWINFSMHHGTGFDPRPFHVVDKVTLGQVQTPPPYFSPYCLSEGRDGEVLKPWAGYFHGLCECVCVCLQKINPTWFPTRHKAHRYALHGMSFSCQCHIRNSTRRCCRL